MKNEFENIHHLKLNALYFLVVDITYRKPHLHFDMELAYVIEGSGMIRTQEHEFEVRAGEAIVFNSCQVHEFLANDSMRLVIMQFNYAAFETALPQLDKIQFESQPFDLANDSLLLHDFLETAQNYFQTGPFLALRVYGLASLTLYELLQTCPFTILSESQQNKKLDLQERIQRISAYIQEHYSSKISLDELAAEEGFSRTYFSHFFKNNLGITFNDYINNIRCEKAQTLLATSRENLLNITYMCGFADIRTLNHAFVKRYGILPRDYRKKDFSALQPEFFSTKPNMVDIQKLNDNQTSLDYIKRYIKLIG